MHRETPIYSTLCPMGWGEAKHRDKCRECGGAIAKGDVVWNSGAYTCCQLCFTEETPEKWPFPIATRGPKDGWVWKPSKSQAALGWDHHACLRDDGSLYEWMDRLDRQ